MSGMTRNSSQDPDYVGPVGHEKKFHKTHFSVDKKPRPGFVWDLQVNERGHWSWVEVPVSSGNAQGKKKKYGNR